MGCRWKSKCNLGGSRGVRADGGDMRWHSSKGKGLPEPWSMYVQERHGAELCPFVQERKTNGPEKGFV